MAPVLTAVISTVLVVTGVGLAYPSDAHAVSASQSTNDREVVLTNYTDGYRSSKHFDDWVNLAIDVWKNQTVTVNGTVIPVYQHLNVRAEPLKGWADLMTTDRVRIGNPMYLGSTNLVVRLFLVSAEQLGGTPGPVKPMTSQVSLSFTTSGSFYDSEWIPGKGDVELPVLSSPDDFTEFAGTLMIDRKTIEFPNHRYWLHFSSANGGLESWIMEVLPKPNPARDGWCWAWAATTSFWNTVADFVEKNPNMPEYVKAGSLAWAGAWGEMEFQLCVLYTTWYPAP